MSPLQAGTIFCLLQQARDSHLPILSADSCRNAAIGSSFITRLAGRYEACRATTPSITQTAARRISRPNSDNDAQVAMRAVALLEKVPRNQRIR